jgi:hypothetical protein
VRIAHPVTFLAFITMKLSSTCSFVSNKGMAYSKKMYIYIYEKSQKANGENPYPLKKDL